MAENDRDPKTDWSEDPEKLAAARRAAEQYKAETGFELRDVHHGLAIMKEMGRLLLIGYGFACLSGLLGVAALVFFLAGSYVPYLIVAILLSFACVASFWKSVRSIRASERTTRPVHELSDRISEATGERRPPRWRRRR